MHGALEFLLKHGYLILFALVLAEQSGLPLPSAPMLLAAGALAGLGKMNMSEALLLAVIASLIGDLMWFYLGRTRGSSILRFLCKISLEPDSCVKQTESVYSRYGAVSLLFAKFVPGLSTVATPMAGMFKLAPWKFILLDGGGAAVWAGSFVGVGWWFRTQLEDVALYLQRFGSWVGSAIVALLVLYISFKYFQRRRLYRSLRIARITPLELKERLDAGELISIVDLRNAVERREGTIPGSLHIKGDDIDPAMPAISEHEVVLFCSCPNEVTSARAALRLRRHGVSHVRPLEGGFPLWRDLGFPVEPVDADAGEKKSVTA